MRDWARILMAALLPCIAALAGCSMFDAWDKTEPPPQPERTLAQNPVEPPKRVARVSPPPTADRTATSATPPADEREAAHFKALMGSALTKVLDASDMTCRLVRVEMVNGVVQKEEVLEFRQRFNPQSLRLKWVGERNRGRDLIYVKGQNDDKVMVKEPGLASVFSGGKPVLLPLDSPLLKAQSRYAPDVAGYNNLVKRIAGLYKDARSLGLAWVAERPSEMVAGRRLQTFELTFESVLLDVDVKRILITFDVADSLPVHTITYDAKNRLVEDYDWQHVRLNAGLTDADFRFETDK